MYIVRRLNEMSVIFYQMELHIENEILSIINRNLSDYQRDFNKSCLIVCFGAQKTSAKSILRMRTSETVDPDIHSIF